jgi:hypothetical protein
MATRPTGGAPPPSAENGAVLYGLHFFFDAFGATRPIRLGVVVAFCFALDAPTRGLLSTFGVSRPSGLTLECSLFGLSFLVFFFPLLLRPTLPEPTAERFLVIEAFAQEIGLSKAKKRLLYLDLARMRRT